MTTETTGDCQEQKVYTKKDKWIIAVFGGLLFLVLSSPFLFSVTNKGLNLLSISSPKGGCPNAIGLILHAILFILIVRLVLL